MEKVIFFPVESVCGPRMVGQDSSGWPCNTKHHYCPSSGSSLSWLSQPSGCDSFQKPVSVSEEELENLRRCCSWGREKTCRAGPMGRASSSIETHGAQFVDVKIEMSLAQRDCPVQKEK